MDKVGEKEHLTPEHLEWRWQYGKENYHGRNSYWSKNKGSSKDAVLRKITTVLGILFILIALLLDSKLF